MKINLHEQLLTLRREVAAAGQLAWSKRVAMQFVAYLFRRPALYGFAGKLGRFALRRFPRALIYGPWNPWGKQRDLPPPPKRSFREEFAKRLKEK